MTGRTGYAFLIRPPFAVEHVALPEDGIGSGCDVSYKESRLLVFFPKSRFSTKRADSLRAFIREAEVEIELAKRELENGGKER